MMLQCLRHSCRHYAAAAGGAKSPPPAAKKPVAKPAASSASAKVPAPSLQVTPSEGPGGIAIAPRLLRNYQPTIKQALPSLNPSFVIPPIEGAPAFQIDSRRLGLVGIKRGMMHTWDKWGVFIPCTLIEIVDNQVAQIRKHKLNNYTVTVGAVNKPPKRINPRFSALTPRRHTHHSPQDIKDIPEKRHYEEFIVSETGLVPNGTQLYAPHFVPGQKLMVKGTTVGKGFQGVMKRHGFKGQPASHGHSRSHRSRGSSGMSRKHGWVRKGTPMAGHMGDSTAVVRGVHVVKIDTKYNVIFVKGAIPGHDNNYVKLSDDWMKQRKMFKTFSPPYPTYIPRDDVVLPTEITCGEAKEDPLMKTVAYVSH